MIPGYTFSKMANYDPYAYAYDYTDNKESRENVQSPEGQKLNEDRRAAVRKTVSNAVAKVVPNPVSKMRMDGFSRDKARNNAAHHLFLTLSGDKTFDGNNRFTEQDRMPEEFAVYYALLSDSPDEASKFKNQFFNSREYKTLSPADKIRLINRMATVWPNYMVDAKVGLGSHGGTLAGDALAWNTQSGNNYVDKPNISSAYQTKLSKGLTPIFTNMAIDGYAGIGADNTAYSTVFDVKKLGEIADNFVRELEQGYRDPKNYTYNPYNMAIGAVLYKQSPTARKLINDRINKFMTDDPGALQKKINFFSSLNPAMDTSKMSTDQKAWILMASGGNKGLLDSNKMSAYGNDVSSYLQQGLNNVIPVGISEKFKNDQKFRDHFITDDFRSNTMSSMLGQLNGYLDGAKDFAWDYDNLVTHAALYNNDPKYHQMFDDKFGSYIGGRIGPNTTPQQLQELYDRLSSVSFDEAEMDKTVQGLKSNPASSMPILAAMHGNMNPDVESMKNTVMAGHRAAGTDAARSSFKNHGLFWKNPREWVVFAHRNKIGNVPDWFGNLAQNRELFWGTIIGGGTLAVGGLAMLVSSFLNRKKDEEEEELSSEYGNGRQRQRKPYIPNTTSMWRAGTNAY